MPSQTRICSPSRCCSGSSERGKTTLLNHVLANREGRRVAVIVNDMSEVNIDAALVAGAGHLDRTEENLVELTNGCICCTLREDLIESVVRLASAGRFDQLLIESTGISEPMPVAASFSWEFDNGFSLGSVARLDTLVMVVDASTFLGELARGEALADRDLAAGDGDVRTIADLLVDQVEFADVILLNKADLVSEKTCARVTAVLRRLNPSANILLTDHGRVPLSEVLDTGLFDPDLAAQSPGWDQEITDGHTPETEEYGISSVTFRAQRPLHPQRLSAALDQLQGLLRSKGFCWIASRPGPGGEMVPGRTQLGDRTSAVLVHRRLRARAGNCVHRCHAGPPARTGPHGVGIAHHAELADGPHEWVGYPDPLPPWGVVHAH
jgi:G3E family GTPase